MKRERNTTTNINYDMWLLHLPPMPVLKARMLANIIVAIDPGIDITITHVDDDNVSLKPVIAEVERY